MIGLSLEPRFLGGRGGGDKTALFLKTKTVRKYMFMLLNNNYEYDLSYKRDGMAGLILTFASL